MYRVYCVCCGEHIYDYTASELPKMGELVDPYLFCGVNGHPDPDHGDKKQCPACGGWSANHPILKSGAGHLGGFMRFERKEEANHDNTRNSHIPARETSQPDKRNCLSFT